MATDIKVGVRFEADTKGFEGKVDKALGRFASTGKQAAGVADRMGAAAAGSSSPHTRG